MGLFTPDNKNSIANRDSKESAVQNLLGSEEVDVSKMDDEELNNMLLNLGMVTTESVEATIEDIAAVMKEMKGTKQDFAEAIVAELGMHLREAKEIVDEYTSAHLQ